jgi:hypothetical protein
MIENLELYIQEEILEIEGFQGKIANIGPSSGCPATK